MSMSNFKSAVDWLQKTLTELIDINTVLNLCKNYKPSEKGRDLRMSDLEQDVTVSLFNIRY